jgi:hypothetical protein
MSLATVEGDSHLDEPMLRFLAANWITSRLARPISRAIPNPYVRAAAVATTGVLVARMLQRGPSRRGA